MIKFALQTHHNFGSLFWVKRLLAISVLLLVGGSCLRGQDQERKLLYRLLKPDTTLQSSEQKKKFTADGTSINKKANVGTFFVEKKSNPKTFSKQRELSTREFNSQSFHGNRAAFGNSSRQAVGNSRTYATQSAPGPHHASQSDKKVGSRAYAQNRPFVDQGKSQKSLNRQNAPLTIDQVRDLLNKNK